MILIAAQNDTDHVPDNPETRPRSVSLSIIVRPDDQSLEPASVLDDPQLSAASEVSFLSRLTHKFVSHASYWEIAIKIGKKKYTLSKYFIEF